MKAHLSVMPSPISALHQSITSFTLRALLILILNSSFTSPALASKTYAGPYRADVYYITDGDTFFARVNLWPGLSTDVNIRIKGIDTPETWRPKCEKEEIAGKAATDFLMQMFDSPYRGAVLGKPMATVELRNVKLGKFAGRVLADVYHDGKDVAIAILESGHARPYKGGKREGWCGD